MSGDRTSSRLSACWSGSSSCRVIWLLSLHLSLIGCMPWSGRAVSTNLPDSPNPVRRYLRFACYAAAHLAGGGAVLDLTTSEVASSIRLLPSTLAGLSTIRVAAAAI